MKKVLGSLVLAGALLTTGAYAKDKRSFGDIYIECGLGGIFGSAIDGTVGDVMAVVTNITWDLGTTAISSNISSDSTCANTKAKTAALINVGYEKLESEIAMGDGEYLNTLASLTNQPKEEIRKEFATVATAKDYDSLTRYQKAEKLFNIVTK